jgi:hypothetical protein
MTGMITPIVLFLRPNVLAVNAGVKSLPFSGIKSPL